MVGLGFQSPSVGLILFALPLLFLLSVRIDGQRRRTLLRIAGARATKLIPTLRSGKHVMQRGFLAAGLVCAILAAMQPTWGFDVEKTVEARADIVVCVDVSRSMLARDLAPNRLLRAKQEIENFARDTRGDRLALVAFAGNARLISPLTKDVDSFIALLEQADHLSVAKGGTDLGAALLEAMRALPALGEAYPAILLMTDGEDHERRGLQVAEACAQRGIVVHCVGIGSEIGSKIAIQEDDGDVFLRARNGDDVITSLDSEGLVQIASATNGDYVNAAAARGALRSIYASAIRAGAQTRAKKSEERRPKVRFQIPLALAFLFLLLDGLTRSRRHA